MNFVKQLSVHARLVTVVHDFPDNNLILAAVILIAMFDERKKC